MSVSASGVAAVIEGSAFDHVALAAESRHDLEPRYVGQLGGAAFAQGHSAGFIWTQFDYANQMTVEVLEPHRVEDNDFLRRFLDRSGPGPHHLTFTVPALGPALEAATVAGYEPVGVDQSSPDWKEAFLHPKDAPGVVIQLAESHEHHQRPTGTRPTPPAELLYVAHAVRSLEEGGRLFEGLLGGVRTAEGADRGCRWVELRWPGPGRLRLIAPTGPGALDAWLGDRAGRVHHLAFATPLAPAVPDAVRTDGCWRIEPEANHGTRVVLVTDRARLASRTPV